MGAIQQMLLANAVAAGGSTDPFFANVVALLHFNGTNGSTTFTDVTGRSWTASGNAQISTTDTKFGTGCLLLDGTDDWADSANDAGMQFGTGDFTIEGWIKPTGFANFPNIFSNRDGGGLTFRITSGGVLSYFAQNAAGGVLSGSLVVSTSVYTHAAVCRASGTTRLFLGGVLDGSFADASTLNPTGTARIGASTTPAAGGEDFNGRIDDFRITKGVARYTATFTPPSSPFPDS